LLKKDKTKRKKKKSKKEKKKRKKHKKDSEDEESEDEKVAQKFIQSASRKPTPCSTKRRDPVEAQLNAQKRAKGVRFGINTMSYMVLLPKNYDKNTKGNDRGGMCRLVELVRGANRHGGASRAGAE
jgi:outer membrane biosynthesis protein TonB